MFVGHHPLPVLSERWPLEKFRVRLFAFNFQANFFDRDRLMTFQSGAVNTLVSLVRLLLRGKICCFVFLAVCQC